MKSEARLCNAPYGPRLSPGPYRFVNREYLIITYRTDPDALAAVITGPLEDDDPVVKFEFIRMPDSTGFGRLHGAGQVIPVRYKNRRARMCIRCFLTANRRSRRPRALGFPKKLASPEMRNEKDRSAAFFDTGLFPLLSHYGFQAIAPLPHAKVRASLMEPGFLLKIIPHVDGPPHM